VKAATKAARRHPVRTIGLAAFAGAALGSAVAFAVATKPIPWPNLEGK
jgi:formate/nitrite transporter FocA (FNT family)